MEAWERREDGKLREGERASRRVASKPREGDAQGFSYIIYNGWGSRTLDRLEGHFRSYYWNNRPPYITKKSKGKIKPIIRKKTLR